MDRRSFIKSSVAAAGTMAVSAAPQAQAEPQTASKPFKLNYAPPFGMFDQLTAGEGNAVDQLRFSYDMGFRGVEDNWMMGRGLDFQKQVAKELERLGMHMGVFVAYADFGSTDFVHSSKDFRDRLKKKMTEAVDLAKRMNATWFTVVPGAYDKQMPMDYQTANVIENLRCAAEVCEPAGKVMVLEPLNGWTNHPGLFLTRIPQAYAVCKAVNSPSCKILNDLYHQQITEGNLINNIDAAWDEIGYFQVADNPGRKEPGTGEINYRNIFKHLYKKGYKGLIGLEHGRSMEGKKGQLAVLEAYRYCDNFEV